LPEIADKARSVWQARWLVIDATGVGEPIAALLADQFSTRHSALGTRHSVFPAG
jgi:hypothetical protein